MVWHWADKGQRAFAQCSQTQGLTHRRSGVEPGGGIHDPRGPFQIKIFHHPLILIFPSPVHSAQVLNWKVPWNSEVSMSLYHSVIQFATWIFHPVTLKKHSKYFLQSSILIELSGANKELQLRMSTPPFLHPAYFFHCTVITYHSIVTLILSLSRQFTAIKFSSNRCPQVQPAWKYFDYLPLSWCPCRRWDISPSQQQRAGGVQGEGTLSSIFLALKDKGNKKTSSVSLPMANTSLSILTVLPAISRDILLSCATSSL